MDLINQHTKKIMEGCKEQAQAAGLRFEEETLDFHRRVREGYLALAQLEPQRFRIIDASRTQESVEKEIMAVLDRALPATQ